MSQDLDADFYEISSDIKEFIQQVDNQHHFRQYILWLERLYNAPLSEKLQRNEYLYILAEQIRQKILKPPFTSIPPSGRLPQLHSLKNLKLFGENEREKIDMNYITTLEVTPAQSLEHLKTIQLSAPFNSITWPLFEPISNVKATKVNSEKLFDTDCTTCCLEEHCNLITDQIKKVDNSEHSQKLENIEINQKEHLELQEVHHLQTKQDEIKILQSRMDVVLKYR